MEVPFTLLSRERRVAECDGCGVRLQDSHRTYGTPYFRAHNVVECLRRLREEIAALRGRVDFQDGVR